MVDGEGHVEPVKLSSGSESEAEMPSRNLKPLEGASSVVWKFFGFYVDNDGRILVADKRKQKAVTCIRCNKKLRYIVTYRKNITEVNMSQQLRLAWRKHLIVVQRF